MPMLQEYEDRIQSLQEQVDRQSMISSITQDGSVMDFDNTGKIHVGAVELFIRYNLLHVGDYFV